MLYVGVWCIRLMSDCMCVYRCHMFLVNVIEIDAPLDLLPATFDCTSVLRLFGTNASHQTLAEQGVEYSVGMLRTWLRTIATPHIPSAYAQAQQHLPVGSPKHSHTRLASPRQTPPKQSTAANAPQQQANTLTLGTGQQNSRKPPPLALHGAASQDGDSSSSGTPSVTSQLHTKGHVLLLMPLAAALVTCKYPLLRESETDLI
jgi:hypothetical protein